MRLAVDRTMQGFYGAPRHGGNKDYASFKMMKLDYPLLVGQNRYGKLITKSYGQ
jgi:gluconate 2-dehydrogenase gamma chain